MKKRRQAPGTIFASEIGILSGLVLILICLIWMPGVFLSPGGVSKPTYSIVIKDRLFGTITCKDRWGTVDTNFISAGALTLDSSTWTFSNAQYKLNGTDIITCTIILGSKIK